MQIHIWVLAVLQFLIGGFVLLNGLPILFIFYVASLTSGVSLGFALFVGLLLTLLAAGAYLIGGIGLLRRRTWSRPLGLGLCGLNLVVLLIVPILSLVWALPIGLFISTYGLWVLRSRSAVQQPPTRLPDYRVLDRVKLISGEQYGHVLLESLSPKTPAPRRQAVLRDIAAIEGLSIAILYSTEDAFKAAFSESYQKDHPNALKTGFLGRLERGTFHSY